MDRVSQDDVVRHWLRVEADKPGIEPMDVEGFDGAKALDELLQLKPGAAAFIWRDAPIDWYRVELSWREFAALHVVEGPEHLHFRALSPDDTIRGAAERIEAGDPERLTAATGVDVPKVLALGDEMPGAADRELVLSTRRGCVPWSIADGNYRAVAKARYVMGGEDYAPQNAYLGVGANPVAVPLRERVCGLLRRVRSIATRPTERSGSPAIAPSTIPDSGRAHSRLGARRNVS